MTLDQIAEDVRKEYRLNNKGNIANPGKFESEPLYVAYFWKKGLLGLAEDDGKGFRFVITQDDRSLFPEIPPKRRVIYLMEDEQGFCKQR